MTSVGRKRMLKLIDFLKRLKANKVPGMSPKRFDMRVWRATGEGVDTPCGTAACAVGHIPDAMPRSGFKMVPYHMQDSEDRVIFYPRYKKESSAEAVMTFFGNITYGNFCELFLPTAYANPSLTNVIKRLEHFVSDEAQA